MTGHEDGRPVRAGPAPRLDAAAPWLVAVGGTALLSTGAQVPSLWFDEAATAAAVRRSPAELWAMLGTVDAVHGLYYLAMLAWTSVAGTSELALRLPSAVAAGLAAAATWALGARLLGTRAAWVAAGALLLLPRVTWAAVEARPPALTVLVAAVATLLLVGAVRDRSWPGLLAYGAVVAAGTVLSVYLALLVLAHGASVVLVSRDRTTVLRWSLVCTGALAAAAPVVLAAYRQAAQLGGVDLGLPLMVRSVLVNQWFVGATPVQNGDGGGSSAPFRLVDALTTSWSLAAVLLAAGCWALVGLGVLGAARDDAGRELLAWLLPWLLVPSVVAVAFSALATPVYHPRYLAFCAPAVALLVAAGLGRVRPRALLVVGVCALVGASAVVAASQRTPTAKDGYDWAQVAAVVETSATPGEGVYYAPRRAGEAELVLRSARLVADAYPAATDGLVDVTLARSATEADALVGQSHRLDADGVAERLARLDGVWVVRWRDYDPGATAREQALLRAAGFTQACRWEGTVSVVEHHVRAVDGGPSGGPTTCPG